MTSFESRERAVSQYQTSVSIKAVIPKKEIVAGKGRIEEKENKGNRGRWEIYRIKKQR